MYAVRTLQHVRRPKLDGTVAVRNPCRPARLDHLKPAMRKATLLLLFVLPAIFWIVVLLTRPNRKSGGSQLPNESTELLASWRFADFTPIVNDSEFRRKIDQIQILNSNLLNNEQTVGLFDTVDNYLMAFHVGTYEAYHRFRAPVSDFRLTSSIVTFLNQNLPKDMVPPPADQEAVFKIYWEKYIGKGWENFWTGISLTNTLVEVQSTTTNIPPLSSYVFARPNLGVARVGASLQFSVTPDMLVKKNGNVLYATVTVLPKNDDVVYPVYCRFYWLPESGKWLPFEQASAYSGRRKTTLQF
jgi:hypothetical protein